MKEDSIQIGVEYLKNQDVCFYSPKQREASISHDCTSCGLHQPPNTVATGFLENLEQGGGKEGITDVQETDKQICLLLSLRFSFVQLITTSAPTSRADSSLPSTISQAILFSE